MQSSQQAESAAQNNGPSSSSANGERSPLGNLALFKNLNAEKKQTKDGQPPKRRGPKPDSKPALTRRQELNRQAQRTHRERKEMYIKALEQEVLRLKEVFAQTARERDQVQQENSRLKELLAQHGISYDFGESPVKFQYHPSSSGSISGSYPPASDSAGFSPPPPLPSGLPVPIQGEQQQAPGGAMHPPQARTNMAQLPSSHLDYDQIGVDFVLTYDSQGRPVQIPAPYPSPPPQQLLERPCMEHMQYLIVRSQNSDEQEFHHPAENPDDREYDHMSGHVMMATCPTMDHVIHKPNEPYEHKMPEVGMPDLKKLLDLSSRLPLNHDSEITPIMAWTQLYQDSRIRELSAQDFDRIKHDLVTKVRCYGFGAVLEEFEVRDALEGVLDGKLPAANQSHFAAPQVAVAA